MKSALRNMKFWNSGKWKFLDMLSPVFVLFTMVKYCILQSSEVITHLLSWYVITSLDCNMQYLTMVNSTNTGLNISRNFHTPVIMIRGGWGCEVSCGGHHRPKGKTTTGSALDGAVFDTGQILAYLVHNMSRSQLYLGFGHFGWLPSFFGQ